VAGARPRHNGGIENLGWYIAAGVLAILILVVGLQLALNRNAAPPSAGMPLAGTEGGAVAESGAPPPLTGTPREQADRLFNRIMTAREAGDTAQVSMFMPMALEAYRAIDLDDDGLYHLAMLENISGDPATGMATAGKILQANPDHLLALATAAEAATMEGDSAAARRYWQHYLDVYEKERGKNLQEYLDHAPILPEYEAAARRALAR